MRNKVLRTILIAGIWILLYPFSVSAQTDTLAVFSADSLDRAWVESRTTFNADSILAAFQKEQELNNLPWSADRDPYFANYNPVPAKAVWYSALFPGGGQIYNRKYWKLPIIYGGYLGLIYGYRFNQRYYRTYSNAYRDLVLNSPNASYMDFLPPNYNVEARRSFLESTFKRKRNFYRQYRDYCLVGMLGVYLVAMVDAYVDASLYHFDVSTDLDANNKPSIMVGYHIDF